MESSSLILLSREGGGRQRGGIRVGTHTHLTYHVIFSTRYRRKRIREGIRERLYEYIGGIMRSQAGHLIEIGGMEDHLHLLMSFSPAHSVSEVVRNIKANASRWANGLSTMKNRFEWQKGYAAFTVSYSQIESVRRYIQNQRDHHRRRTFAEEYVEFLKQHGIEFDRRHLFETEHQG